MQYSIYTCNYVHVLLFFKGVRRGVGGMDQRKSTYHWMGRIFVFRRSSIYRKFCLYKPVVLSVYTDRYMYMYVCLHQSPRQKIIKVFLKITGTVSHKHIWKNRLETKVEVKTLYLCNYFGPFVWACWVDNIKHWWRF